MQRVGVDLVFLVFDLLERVVVENRRRRIDNIDQFGNSLGHVDALSGRFSDSLAHVVGFFLKNAELVFDGKVRPRIDGEVFVSLSHFISWEKVR